MAGSATHVLLYGGSRSGKTFLLIRAICMRALKAKGSRHAVLRFRFNHLKASIVYDTFPKAMETCFPQVPYKLNKEDWFAEFPNKSQVWFGGLDDKERTEKVLGNEYATLFLNECSQIPKSSRDIAVTRLAQKVAQVFDGKESVLKPRMYYDCNPPSKSHWSYELFMNKRDPDRKRPLTNPDDYACLKMNPQDNAAHTSADYLQTLQSLNSRLRKRFLEGDFSEATPNALWTEDMLEKARVESVPDMQRIIVAVDPSGAGDTENAENDEIGISVVGLGTDGVGYVLEDVTVKGGPAMWGKVATSAFDRHSADIVVGEANFGGDMVRHVIQTARPGTRYKAVTASRGKVVRAEPIAALFETGKAKLVGEFKELETELCGFSTTGYTGEGSPNRADAMVWGMSELFPGMVKKETNRVPEVVMSRYHEKNRLPHKRGQLPRVVTREH